MDPLVAAAKLSVEFVNLHNRLYISTFILSSTAYAMVIWGGDLGFKFREQSNQHFD